MKLKYGIIGTGRATGIANGHYMACSMDEDLELIGIYNSTRATGEQWCDSAGLSHDLIYEDADRLIEDADIISICTPNFAHCEYLLKCLKHGTAVLCEKPLCSSMEDAQKVKDALEGNKTIGMINFNYRRLPGIEMLHKMGTAGEFGTIYSVRQSMGAPRLANESVPFEWRMSREKSGSGAIGDFGSHALDLLNYILGTENAAFTRSSVEKSTFIPFRTGKNGQQQPVENDDCAMVQARLACGAMYALTVSRVGSADSRIEIIGSHAIAVFDLSKPNCIRVQRRENGGYFGKPEEVAAENLPEYWNAPIFKPYIGCALNVLRLARSIRGEEMIDTPLSYGFEMMKLIDYLDKMGK